MIFFDDTDVSDLAESHVEKIEGLEDSEAKRVLKLYRRVRSDLRDRLDSLAPGTFTAQKMRATLVQVESAIVKMNDVLGREMKGSSRELAGVGIQQLERELFKWDKKFTGAAQPIDLDAVKIATDTSNFLFNKYESSLESYGASLRSQFANGLANAVVEESTVGEVVGRLSQVFLGEEWRLTRLVRTELHGVYNFSKIAGMKDLVDGDIPDLMKTLYHPMDSRTGKDSKKLARNNPIVPVDEPFVETSTGKKLSYMAPPNRPNDRAILIPYRKAWGE